MVSFGMAPALVIYLWGLSGMGKLGWLAAFFYAACAALRLARFNTQVESADKNYFQGLASPAAAACLMGWVWIGSENTFNPTLITVGALIVTLVCGGLMVSTLRYSSFKGIDLTGKVPFIMVLAIVLVFVLISLDPAIVLFSLFSLYALSGIGITLWQVREKRLNRTAK